MPDEKNPKSAELAAAKSTAGAAGSTTGGPGDTATRVQLERTVVAPNPAQTFWAVIRNRSIDFNQYKAYIDAVMCCVCDPTEGRDQLKKEGKLDLRLPFPGVRSCTWLRS